MLFASIACWYAGRPVYLIEGQASGTVLFSAIKRHTIGAPVFCTGIAPTVWLDHRVVELASCPTPVEIAAIL